MIGPSLEQIELRIKDAKALVIDLETSGLDWKRHHSVGYVLAFGPAPDDSVYLPIRHASSNLDMTKVIGSIRSGLRANPNIRLVNHALSFDLKFMEADGLPHSLFGALEDTQINACVIDERQRSFSLAACCEFMKVQAKKGEELYRHLAGNFGGEPGRAQMANFHLLDGDDPLAVEYATGDGTSTWQLWEAQQEELDRQDLRQAWAIECRVIRVLHRMTTRGVKVDEERLHQVIQLVRAKQLEAEAKLPKGFNVKAPSQMMKLFTDAGITDWPKTELGNPSFTADWLETTPTGRDVVAVRKLRHLDNSFLTPMLERHLWKGRVHTNFSQSRGEEFGTITYRLASNDPNLQQVHRRDAYYGAVFRSIFVPDDGMTWAYVDYAQIEPRLLAQYGQVRALIDGYLSSPPIDAHSSVAISVFGSNFTKDDREKAKRINQAILTGAGRDKIALMVGGPRQRAMEIVDTYFASMPEIKAIQRRSKDVLQARGYVRCLMGHRARLEDSRFAYKALNRLLQTGNAGVLKLSMARIDEFLVSEGDTAHLLNNVHDAFDFQFHESDRTLYERSLEMMRDFGPGRSVELVVPLEVESGEGDSWSTATYGRKAVDREWEKWGERYDKN